MQTYYVVTDHLGTPQVLTDQNQAVVWQSDATPFGEEQNATTLQSLRFPGQYADAESGYSYNYFRDYDPRLGRYVQSDPIGLRGGVNGFAYVKSNPLGYTDDLGLAPVCNCTSQSVMVGGGPGPGEGHQRISGSVPHLQASLAPGQCVDENNPIVGSGTDRNGNPISGPIYDVDSIDFNGDGKADKPGGYKDYWPVGEKVPGDDRGLTKLDNITKINIIPNPSSPGVKPSVGWR